MLAPFPRLGDRAGLDTSTTNPVCHVALDTGQFIPSEGEMQRQQRKGSDSLLCVVSADG